METLCPPAATVTAEELVAFSLFRSAGGEWTDTLLGLRPTPDEYVALGYHGAPLSVEGSVSASSERYAVLGEAAALLDGGRALHLVMAVPEAEGEVLCRACRLLGTLLAALLQTPRRLVLTCLCRESGSVTTEEQVLKKSTLACCEEEAVLAYSLYGASELAKKKKRMPKMRRLSFPYPSPREGQEELMKAVYRTISHGGRLYASAPTGIGKTISTLYPAVRAMGEGKCRKVFYLTAKATAARAACDAAALLGKSGALRTLALASKERLCPRRGRLCREGLPCQRQRASEARVERACMALLEERRPLVMPEDVARVATAHEVCPHALALAYSELADLVICDYNYLFDPAVRLSRYFERGGQYALLIDEAHNLADRVRETYTLSLGQAELLLLAPPPETGETPPSLTVLYEAAVALSCLLSSLVPMGEAGVTARRSLPEGMVEGVTALALALRECWQDRKLPEEKRRQLRGLYYETKTKLDILSEYGEGFCWRAVRGEDGVSFSVLCLDPAGVVARALGKGGGAVLFSATLSPISYYRDLLGGGGNDELLELPSPFERDNLAVAVMDKISLRFADREETLGEVAQAVVATARARAGNYMVFCPSFAYVERLFARIEALAPTLRLLRQAPGMSPAARRAFLDEFEGEPVLALCVLGGIFGEGVDLVGKRLIGAVVIGVGLSTPSRERDEMAHYYAEKYEAGGEYAYLYPGMNRVLQAAGRVIRSETDEGVLVLIDDRFATPLYRRLLPPHWRGLSFVGNTRSLVEYLRRFWHGRQEEGEQ